MTGMTCTEKEVAVYTLLEGSGKVLVFLNSLDLIYCNLHQFRSLQTKGDVWKKCQLAVRLNCQRPCATLKKSLENSLKNP